MSNHLTHAAVVQMLGDAEQKYRRLDAAFEKLSEVLGPMANGELFDACWRTFEAYLWSVGELVGEANKLPDGMRWINWHCYENNWGKKGMSAKEGHMPKARPIKTNAYLAALMGFPKPAKKGRAK